MATYTAAQVSVMARSVGWPNPDLVGQIAMAESSGRSDVVNSIGAVGLLQVNQPVHVKDHPSWTVAYLQDPINNLRAGLVLYNQDRAAGGSGYRPWVSSQNGPGGWGSSTAATTASSSRPNDSCDQLYGPAYTYCENGLHGAQQDAPGDPGGSVLDTATELARLAQAVAKAGNWIANPGNWVRVAYVVGGTLLALAAVSIIAKPYVGSAQAALPVEGTKTAVRRTKATHAAVKKYGGQILEGLK